MLIYADEPRVEFDVIAKKILDLKALCFDSI